MNVAYVRALELSQASDRNRVVDTFSDRLVAPPTQSKMFQELDTGGAYTLRARHRSFCLSRN